MKVTFFDQYERAFDEKDVLRSIKMPEDHVFGSTIAALLERTDPIAKPKGFFMECEVEEITEATVTAGGQVFQSAVLAKKLKDHTVVYPYLSTCGRELADYAKTITDSLEQFAFDAVMEFYYRQIDAQVGGAVHDLLPEEKVVSCSNPGSLMGWHIREQKKLFSLFGENAEKIGVELNDSYLMFPVKSVAGIRFESDGVIHDCELCRKSNCRGRKAPFSMKAYLAAKGSEEM
ncbi:MAG: hypothetical protein ACI3W6_07730 [Clostridia bacterium]